MGNGNSTEQRGTCRVCGDPIVNRGHGFYHLTPPARPGGSMWPHFASPQAAS